MPAFFMLKAVVSSGPEETPSAHSLPCLLQTAIRVGIQLAPSQSSAPLFPAPTEMWRGHHRGLRAAWRLGGRLVRWKGTGVGNLLFHPALYLRF